MNAPLAIIDLGTNTFHLLIAEKKHDRYEIVHREKQAVKIGAGGINQGVITDAGLARAIETLGDFKSKLANIPPSRVFTFGTSAFRNASNQTTATREIKAKTGLDIVILSGQQEAEFIYYGVQSALNLGTGKSLIMDIGGGSVEFIIGSSKTMFWKESIEIGGQRLLEEFQKHDPITGYEINALDSHFAKTLPALFEALGDFKPYTLVGSSGTFDTLSDIYCTRKEIHKNEDDPETALSIEGFNEIYNEFITKDRTQRLAIPGMIEMRVDMIVVACCLIRYLLEHYAFQNIRVSGYSLKEGVLHYLSNRLS